MALNEARAARDLPLCDLVLKGGVTSAVIYARFLHSLAASYRFKHLGGTSAGAIGAAAGAVAQRARLDGIAGSFEKLKELPEALGAPHVAGGSKLLRLFQPAAATARVFRVVEATVDGDRGGSWKSRLLKAVLWNFGDIALLASLPGLWLVVTAFNALPPQGASWWPLLTLLIGVVVLFVSLLLALGLAALWSGARGLLANHFGLCTGMPAEPSQRDTLTVWLHDFLNQLRGRAAAADPVTFGDLWGAEAVRNPKAARDVDLQVITTALNLRRPIRIPGDGGDKAPLRPFYYDPDEWAAFFPPEVMAWMAQRARVSKSVGRVAQPGYSPLLPLPEMADLPVIVAVRLSLAFPLLLSAVPVYMVDWTLPENLDARHGDGPLRASKLYFSDGGLCSNFPVHLFDAPLPGHPTFAVNLGSRRADQPAIDRLPNSSEVLGQGCAEFEAGGLASLVGFGLSIFETARNWRDTMQQVMPGYRDRIVRIGQAPGEGGLNLAMSKEVIADLGQLGDDAARRIVLDFIPGAPDSAASAWSDHRWTRMRSTLCMTKTYLDNFSASLSKGDARYDALPQVGPAPHYRFDTPADAIAACDFMRDTAALMASPAASSRFCDDAPNPRPMLTITPSW